MSARSAPSEGADAPRLLVATTNQHKVEEIRHLLSDAPVHLMGLDAFPPITEPEETGATFEANALLKATYYASFPGVPTGMLTVAEDSGLEIDPLGGEPGVRSARFVRPDASYPERFDEIYRRLEGLPAPHTARFVCAVAVIRGGQVLFEARGTIEGEIAPAPSGTRGFGYDPIFYYPPFGRTLADVSQSEKLAVAHRGKAFRALAAWLKTRT